MGLIWLGSIEAGAYARAYQRYRDFRLHLVAYNWGVAVHACTNQEKFVQMCSGPYRPYPQYPDGKPELDCRG